MMTGDQGGGEIEGFPYPPKGSGLGQVSTALVRWLPATVPSSWPDRYTLRRIWSSGCIAGIVVLLLAFYIGRAVVVLATAGRRRRVYMLLLGPGSFSFSCCTVVRAIRLCSVPGKAGGLAAPSTGILVGRSGVLLGGGRWAVGWVLLDVVMWRRKGVEVDPVGGGC